MRRIGWLPLVLLSLLPGLSPAREGERLDGGVLTPNLVANPSMEDGSAAPSSWTFETGGGEGTWDRVAPRGGRSLRIDGVGAWRSAPFALAPGKVTLLEIDTRLQGSGRWGGLARVDFLGEDGTRIGKLDPFLPDEHAWRRMHWGGVAPPGTVAGVLACYTYRDSDVTFWCDDASVRQWTDAEPIAVPGRGLPESVRGFDFGTGESALETGYIRVTPQSRYRADRAFGWTASVRLAAVDQPDEQYRPAELDERGEPTPRSRTFLDALTRDFVRGVGAARFRVDVPPGRYHVFLLAGHSVEDAAPPYIDLVVTAGTRHAARLEKRVPGVGFVWDTIEVEATERGAEVGLASDRFGGTWGLVALLIWPVDDPAGWEEADRVRRSVEELPDDLLAGLHRIPVPPGPAGPAPGAALRLPFGEATLRGSASPGLSADFGFTLRPRQDLTGCRARIEVVSPGGGAAPAEAWLWAVGERALRYNESYISHEMYTVQPDELTRRIPARLRAGVSQPFWLRVRLPAHALPTEIHGAAVHFDCPGIRESVLRAEVRPLPFGADAVGGIQNVYLRGAAGIVPDRAPRGVRSEAEQLRASSVRDIVDHLGKATPALGRWGVYRASGGEFRVETAFAREELEDFRRAGQPAEDAVILLQPILRQLARQMIGEEAGKLGKHVSGPVDLPATFWEVFGGLVDGIDREVEAAGVALRLYNPWDEAHGDDLPVFIRASRVVRERLPGARIFCNVPTSVYYHGGDAGQDLALADHCDTWWTYGILTDAQRAQESRRGTWLLGGLVAEGYTEARAASGLLRWRRGERGGNWWSYDAYLGSASTQLDGPSYGDRCLVYPTSPPSPRLAWEASRLGHEDLRYLRTLERLVEERRDNPDRSRRRAAAAGARLLEDLRERVDPSLPDPLGGPGEYDVVRDRIVAAIRQIVAAGD